MGKVRLRDALVEAIARNEKQIETDWVNSDYHEGARDAYEIVLGMLDDGAVVVDKTSLQQLNELQVHLKGLGSSRGLVILNNVLQELEHG